MTVLGADSNAPMDPQLLLAAKRTFVLRYLSDDAEALTRNLRIGEAYTYAQAGIRVGTVWQNGNSQEVLGGYNAGRRAADVARTQQRYHGLTGAPIFFAVDFPTNPDNIDQVIEFFRGVRSVIGYDRVGAYGTWYTVKRLHESGHVKYLWQTKLWDRWSSDKPTYEAVDGVQYGNADLEGWDHFGSTSYVAHDWWQDSYSGLVIPSFP